MAEHISCGVFAGVARRLTKPTEHPNTGGSSVTVALQGFQEGKLKLPYKEPLKHNTSI